MKIKIDVQYVYNWLLSPFIQTIANTFFAKLVYFYGAKISLAALFVELVSVEFVKLIYMITLLIFRVLFLPN